MPIIRHGYAKQRNVDSAARRRARAEVIANATFCHICGRPFTIFDTIEADHITPVADGGTHHTSNLRPAHRSCNRSRGRGGGVNP